MNRANKNILIISSIILIIIIWSILLYYIKPSEIVEAIGINNGYLITFLVALFAGASAITSTTYYATIITFSLGDLNPILLALMVGPALVIGDSIFFFIGYKISKIARGQLKEKMNITPPFDADDTNTLETVTEKSQEVENKNGI